MAVILSEEQLMLRESAQTFLADQSPVTRMRELRDAYDEKGFTPDVWKQMADLGWLGILLAEDHGGSGMGVADLGVVLWECGKVLAPEPLLSTLLLGANAVRLSGNEPLQKDVLPAVAEGDRVVALALEETGRFNPTTSRRRSKGARSAGRSSTCSTVTSRIRSWSWRALRVPRAIARVWPSTWSTRTLRASRSRATSASMAATPRRSSSRASRSARIGCWATRTSSIR